MKLYLIILPFLVSSCSTLSWLGFGEEEEKPDYEKMNASIQTNAQEANNSARRQQNMQVDNNPNIRIGTSRVVDIDSKKVEALKKKAMHGDAHAQYQLGLCYKYGYGMKYSRKSAEYWLKKASDQGHFQAKKVYFHLLRSR